MQPKLIRTDLAEYQPGVYDGENRSGITPIGDRVLVLPDQPMQQTSGGIHLPEELRERHAMAAETGVIVAMGEAAFYWNSDRTRHWEGTKPQVGDHVCMQRYSGVVFTGDDGQKYRIMDDTCIAALRKAPLNPQTEA